VSAGGWSRGWGDGEGGGPIATEDDGRKELILVTVDDLVGDLLFYDRKEDEDLPRGVIEEAIREGVVTIAEMVARFEAALRDGLSTGKAASGGDL
jgi:hypothetical protein